VAAKAHKPQFSRALDGCGHQAAEQPHGQPAGFHDECGARRAEVGWVLEDNQGMVAIADAIKSTKNREYTIWEKTL
jgi:hypothetical protein